MVFRRRRNLAMFGVLAAFPILIGISVKLSAPNGNEGPAFLGQITENGLFLGFTSLVVGAAAVPAAGGGGRER